MRKKSFSSVSNPVDEQRDPLRIRGGGGTQILRYFCCVVTLGISELCLFACTRGQNTSRRGKLQRPPPKKRRHHGAHHSGGDFGAWFGGDGGGGWGGGGGGGDGGGGGGGGGGGD
ncbi:hypothetical protein FRC03_006494 [Tulasnella sp. 419]|nr:hypothetical protein FRC03_006494 [Tulasnella sp. 419]